MVNDIKGAKKAAVFLVSLGDELATKVMKHLTEKEIELLGGEMSSVRKVTSDMSRHVSEDFVSHVESGSGGLSIGGIEYMRKILERLLSPEKAREMLAKFQGFEPIVPVGKGLEIVNQLDYKTVAAFLRGEHPQTCAIVLAHMDGTKIAEIMSELPEAFQSEVALRMATLERVSPSIIKELDAALAEEFSEAGAEEGSELGGIEAAADFLNKLDHATESRILSDIEGTNPEVAEEIRKLMFIFEDLVGVDNRGMQEILKEVSSDDLVLALKTASEPLKEKIFANMSERASLMMREDLEVMGPVRVSDVEKAQQSIIRVAKKLEAAGTIMLVSESGGGGEFV